MKEEQPHFEHPQPQSQQPAYGEVYSPDKNLSGLQNQIQDLTRRLDDYEARRVNFNTDIIGLFETVSAAPTIIPTSPYEQVKISVIAGTTAFNIYDATNHVWKKVTIT